jgi:hypothetical protein
VLDQLTRISRIEHPIEVLAQAEIDGPLELRRQRRVVGYGGVVERE